MSNPTTDNDNRSLNNEETRQQIIVFLNNLLSFPMTTALLHEVLSSKGLEITTRIPLPNLVSEFEETIKAKVPEENRDNCRHYLLNGLASIRKQHLDQHNHSISGDELRRTVSTLIEKFLSGAPDIPITLDLIPELLPTDATKTKTNKEQGITQFISLCKESKAILSSVDMYNHYRRWCHHNGYGYCSAPTLTKYLRESDKKESESVSDKKRSQGWYLITP